MPWVCITDHGACEDTDGHGHLFLDRLLLRFAQTRLGHGLQSLLPHIPNLNSELWNDVWLRLLQSRGGGQGVRGPRPKEGTLGMH